MPKQLPTGTLVQATFVNFTAHYAYGDEQPSPPFTHDVGRLFRCLQREYGRCVSCACVGDGVRIGWVFRGTVCYEDCPRCRGRRDAKHSRYEREVWVSFTIQGTYLDFDTVTPTPARFYAAR